MSSQEVAATPSSNEIRSAVIILYIFTWPIGLPLPPLILYGEADYKGSGHDDLMKESGMAWLCLAWLGLAWLGLSWLGLACPGTVVWLLAGRR